MSMRSTTPWNDHLSTLVMDDVIVCVQARDGRNNLIAINWKTVGWMWGDPVIAIGIKQERYSCDLLGQGVPEFTINYGKNLEKAISYCGNHSGRDVDKVRGSGLTLIGSRKVSVPTIAEAELTFECEIINTSLSEEFYNTRIFYGKILTGTRPAGPN